MEKLPPIAKIYEAFTCIADNRIEMKENEAIVSSSDGKKKYTIKWKNNDFTSNDNATFWQGYPGYPVLAVLMIQNRLSYKKEIVNLFANINWHALNEKYKRNYDVAIEEVLSKINYDTAIIKEEVNKIYEEIKNLDIHIKRKID